MIWRKRNFAITFFTLFYHSFGVGLGFFKIDKIFNISHSGISVWCGLNFLNYISKEIIQLQLLNESRSESTFSVKKIWQTS